MKYFQKICESLPDFIVQAGVAINMENRNTETGERLI